MTSCPPERSRADWVKRLIPCVMWVGMWVAQGSFAQPSTPKATSSGVRVVVLDTGHGGPDEGTRGPTGLLEKHITLEVARDAARLIEQLLGLRAVLTRTDDDRVPLETRAALANQAGGNLFISIHAGGSFAPVAHGFQTFYLDRIPGVSPLVRDDARAGALTRRGQAQPGASLQPRVVLWEHAHVDFLETSQAFARLLDKNLRAQMAEEGRGTLGLPLLVLRWVRMPAVLVDLGSISDPAFEGRVRDEAYLNQAALGIAQAVNDYLELQR